MAINSTKNRYRVDGKLVLRDGSAAAATTSVNTDPISLDALTSVWNSGDLTTLHKFALVIEVSAIDLTDTNETYTFAIQTDTTSAFGGTVVTHQTLAVKSVGQHVIIVDRDDLARRDSDAKFLRVALTVGGSTPSIKFGVRAAPVVGE